MYARVASHGDGITRTPMGRKVIEPGKVEDLMVMAGIIIT